MKKIKSHFKFNKQERNGIFFLLLIIVVLQGVHLVYISTEITGDKDLLSVDTDLQAEIDELKKHQLESDTIPIYPFNPNFITDYKGYALGMSVSEIDRLHDFRAQNKFVNSDKEFQEVTQVSDSLLEIISPYFRFPEWTKHYNTQSSKNKKVTITPNENLLEIKDLNIVTAEELQMVNGIGDILSARIIKFRNRLGGFLVDEQLYDVYGLEAEVVQKTLERFKVLNPPMIKKTNINTASVKEIAKLVYIQYNVAQKIVVHRENIGAINSFEELEYIEGFPSDKINRIQLYLSLR
ncbi:DNA uptake protein ComE-like DNA-binding protein [Saonia flava]|uniref:DNA uptake protein ComE-like DNA-binding protein n=1 Tax=Saonia flava TaxID=523696 RepID=A0A846QZW2_9FLAO|nr:helix-hairpin-helix domain-containing protein [Saonia flava]NJB70664.1 DNA uptake protein ComE-like DNA-binding protein [Saonia flava]